MLRGEEMTSSVLHSGMDAGGEDVESLLGPGFHAQLPPQSLQHIDLTFVESLGHQQYFRHEWVIHELVVDSDEVDWTSRWSRDFSNDYLND